MKILKLVLTVLFVVVLIGSAYLLYDSLIAQNTPSSSPDGSGETLERAPDFTVYDAAGNEVSLESLAGKPAIINLWASWCGPCQDEMPHFETFYAELGEDINFLMINMTDGGRETRQKAESFIADNGYTFPVAFDTSESAAAAFSVRGIPVTYFLDAESNIVAYNLGTMDEATLKKYIDQITK